MNALNRGAALQNGKYIIDTVLGQGGFGITYEAEQVSLGRKVAVKEFFMKDICNRDESTSHVSVPSVGSKELVEKFRQKFVREAKMIAALDHEHIVKIHDVFEENGTAYYVMEYLGGGSLGDGVKAGKAMSEGDALKSIRQVASALLYLHKKGIIHFDVKPSNVLKTENGKLKLIDFGISKHYDEAGQQTSSTPVGISKGYAPLEQYQQGSDIKSFTPATDIYALGATFYALLTGSNPPEASVIYEDGLPIITGISPNVMHAIEKAMQPRRKDRPQSVEEFLRLLDGPIADDEETVVPGSGAGDAKTGKGKSSAIKPTEPKKTSEPKPERKKSKGFPKWLYGLFAGIAVAVLAVVLFNRSDNPDETDVPLTDSTAVVAEVIPEKSVTSQPSASASKPETPAKPSSSTTGTHNGHEWVDLGLSVKWATCNVGASSPEGYGNYYAWGETRPKNDYGWDTYKYCNGSYDSMTKYCTDLAHGSVDNRTKLELSDDAARASWGGSWRMPTIAEYKELIDKCTWTWTTLNGKNGYKVVTKSNGNSIFLPAAGYRDDTSLDLAGRYGYYCSSSLDGDLSYRACGLDFNSNFHNTLGDCARCLGLSVRPVFR